MKIRSLKQYVELLTGQQPDENQIGKQSEPLLRKIYGDNKNINQVITEIANFAADVEEQIFYEFVQNAYDAQANALLFYANKDYFFVINNGKSFYTDKEKENINENEYPFERKGQLFEFLAKNKSAKYGDSEAMGNYGQGSKLLYKLIDDATLGSEEDSQLKAIKDEKKGPYLLSWHEKALLDQFLSEHKPWERQDPEDEEKGLLLCKLIYTYYPVTPLEYPVFFSEDEVKAIRTAFDTLVDPRSKMNLFGQGTALIIPLGQGKYEKLTDKDNIRKVKERLGGFISLIGDQLENQDRQIKRLFVINEEIQVESIKSVFVDLKIENQDYRYQFAFNEHFAENGKVNFYKYLPIPETKYNLGFIVDCPKFEVDSSRQRIKDTTKTEQQLLIAFKELVKELEKQTKDKNFDAIYDAIISTRWKDNKNREESAYVMRVFEQTLLKFVQDNIRTNTGNYIPSIKVYKPSVAINIPLQQLAIVDKQWIDKDIQEKISDRMGIEIRYLSLLEIVKEADKSRMAEWIKGLNENDYSVLYKELNKHIEQIKDIKFLRSNKCKVFSFNDLRDSQTPVFYETTSVNSHSYKADLDIEYISTSVNGLDDESLLEKVQMQTEYFSSSNPLKCVAINIFNALATSYAMRQKILKITIFSDMDNNRKPFKELFAKRPAGTALFDSFVVKGFIPDNTDKSWFLDTPKEQWDWIKNHVNLLMADNSKWGKYVQKNLADIKQIADNYSQWNINSDGITLNLDKGGNPINEATIFLEKTGELNKEEYLELTKFFSSHGKFIPYEFLKTLISKPFKPCKKLNISDLISEKTLISQDIFRVLIKKVMGIEYCVSNYRIETHADGFTITPLVRGREKNYCTNYGNEDIFNFLSDNGFYCIPNELQNGISPNYRLESNETLACEILRAMNDVSILLPIVKQSNIAVKNEFFKQLNKIELANIENNESSIEWQILKFAVANDNSVKSKLYFNDERLSTSIKSNNVTIDGNGHNYKLYDLVERYKTENEQIDEVLKLIPDEPFFRNNYLDEEDIDTNGVFKEIANDELNLYQLQFCLDYAIEKKLGDDVKLQKQDSLEFPVILNMVSEKVLKGFDKYLNLTGYKHEIQFYADNTFLLEEERLPDWIKNKDESIRKFFDNKFETGSSKYIQLRKSYKDDTYYKNDFAPDCAKLQNTITWIVEQKKEVVYKSNQFKLLTDFILSLPKELNTKYFLKYTGNFSDKHEPMFIFAALQGNVFFDKKYLNDLDNFNKHKLKTIFKQYQVFFKDGERILAYYKIDNWQEVTIERTCNGTIIKKKEWNNPIYKKWKEETKLTLFTSISLFNISVKMVLNGQEICSQDSKTHPFFRKDNEIIIQSPDQTPKTVLKQLERHQEAMRISQEFIRLQSMFLDDTMNNNINIPEDKKELVDKVISSDKPILIDKYGFTDIPDSDLEKLFKNKNKILNDDLEEGKEPEIEAIYGYIGELLYKGYLEKVGSQYVYAAEEEAKNEYDFTRQEDGNTIYIDVKTTIKSVKDGTAPFYIHKTQHKFLKDNPDKDYRIIRLSLSEMEIEDKAKKIKDSYKGKNPREDSKLKNDCEELVEDYWNEHKISDFTKTIHEYKVNMMT
jgi:hypothetical protein